MTGSRYVAAQLYAVLQELVDYAVIRLTRAEEVRPLSEMELAYIHVSREYLISNVNDHNFYEVLGYKSVEDCCTALYVATFDAVLSASPM